VSPLDLGIAGLYVAGVLAVGVLVSRSLGGFRDFFVAGGRMSAPVLVCTLVSTYYGLDVLFGGSEVGYVDGVVGWFFYTRPYYVAIIVVALLLAPRVRRGGTLSLPDVAANAYGRPTQAVVAVASFFYSLPLLAIMGLGVLMDVLLGWPLWLGVVLGALVSVVYTLLGGLMADALTDTVQFTLMCVTLGIASALVLEGQGGVEGLRAALPPSYFDPRGTYPLAVLLVFGLSALSVLVEPAFYQRIVAARSYRALLVALAIGVVLWASFDWVVTILGMAARARGLDVEPRYALLMLALDVLPVGLEGLFVAGVIATAMSTIDSYLLISGGNLAYDLYRPWTRRPLDDAALLRLTRWGIVVASIASVACALLFSSMVSAWVFMSTVLVAAALVPVLAALLLPVRPPPAAGLWSAGAGLATALVVVALVGVLGDTDPDWGTRIWRFTWRGRAWEIWQEYAVLAALPVALLAFGAGWGWGRVRRTS
jgi:SSS family solute:Na+ symporter